MSKELSPQSGQNIFGIAVTKNDGNKLVRVVWFDDAIGFYHCVEVETGKKIRVYRQDFTVTKKG